MIDNTDLPFLTIFLRLLVALLLGAAIGLERERVERAAGLRTVTLVSVGSALFMIISSHGLYAESTSGVAAIRFDPSRLAAQVVSGIGFLGAGAILLRRNLVRGLTTAATVWATAAIGLAAGAGLLMTAVITTVMILFVLMVLKPLELRLFRRRVNVVLAFSMPRRPAALTELRTLVHRLGGVPRSLSLREVSPTRDRFELQLEIPRELPADRLLQQVRALDQVADVVLEQPQTQLVWHEDGDEDELEKEEP
jgi:putative Mg2+ transporter-C (MgtC) family protein